MSDLVMPFSCSQMIFFCDDRRGDRLLESFMIGTEPGFVLAPLREVGDLAVALAAAFEADLPLAFGFASVFTFAR